MNNIHTNILIIGAGASGITAAISAARRINQNGKDQKVTLIEKNDKVGKKILVTGNGKCNLSNKNISINSYNKSANIIEPLLNEYNSDFVRIFLKKIGLLTKADSAGRIYPYTGQGSSVLDALRAELIRCKVETFKSIDIISVSKKKDKFIVTANDFNFIADKVIVSVGGLASPGKVFAENMYLAVKKFGHTFIEPIPALAPVKTSSGFEKSLKGIRWNAKITLLQGENELKEEFGEVQFAEYGLSGICVFQLSGLVGKLKKENKNTDLKISIDLMPEYSFAEILNILKNRVKYHKDEALSTLFVGILNNKLGQAVLKQCKGLNLSIKLSKLTDDRLSNIVRAVKGLKFKVDGVQTFKYAQVMSGGFSLDEFNLRTMESLRIKGLYLTGEMLDVDGLCGGFNLHWAWISGYIAGENAAE